MESARSWAIPLLKGMPIDTFFDAKGMFAAEVLRGPEADGASSLRMTTCVYNGLLNRCVRYIRCVRYRA